MARPVIARLRAVFARHRFADDAAPLVD